MLHGLDALGGDQDAQRSSDIDDRAHQLALFCRAWQHPDQFPVDLQCLRAQLQQADDRGVASAEVVDLDIDPQAPELPEIGDDGLVAIIERDRFQQLERDRTRSDLQRLQLLPRLGSSSLREETLTAIFGMTMPSRSHWARSSSACSRMTPSMVATTLISSAIAQEPIRRQQPVLAMLPAGEGLDAGDIKRASIELRLIEGHEFVPFEADENIVSQALAGDHLAASIRGEEFVAVAAAALAR
jgi:hypothetical protein